MAPPLRRSVRPLAVAAVAVLLALGGCSGSDSSTAATGTAPATTGKGDVVALAQAFAASLSDEQRAALDQPYTFANAANWSNFPNALLTGGGGPPGQATSSSTGRVGVQTNSLSDAQWTALRALIGSATGSAANEGYDEVSQHLGADDYLEANGGGDDYGRGNFFVAFLGTPSNSGTWELQMGGHHLAIANTYVDGRLAGATPSFRGIEPLGTVTQDGVSLQPEQQERAAFAALLGSLDQTQATTAKLATSYNDLVLGPGNDWAFPTTAEGLLGSALTAQQKDLVTAAMRTYVGDVTDADGQRILDGYVRELDQTRVAYSGGTAVDAVGDYVRIDGPSVWIEFSLQNGIVLDGAHPHAVWRDRKTDYAGTRS